MKRKLRINIYEGNLLSQANEDVIVQQTNTQGRMSVGLGLAISKKWPKVLEKYLELCEAEWDSDSLLGRIQCVHINKYQQVCNLFAQSLTPMYDDGTRYTDYEAFREGLIRINKQFYGKRVAFPYHIGCDKGGGDWGIILDMIIENCPDIAVSIYKLK